MPFPASTPDTSTYLRTFARYQCESGLLTGLDPDSLRSPDDRLRQLFQHVCHLLIQDSAFNRAMPQEFRRAARRYLESGHATPHDAPVDPPRYLMLGDLFDYVEFYSRMGQAS